ncbi:hypothetical protein [Pontibacter deserti]|nr:hypothetical protein [Pontibacter sp. KCTC 32443]
MRHPIQLCLIFLCFFLLSSFNSYADSYKRATSKDPNAFKAGVSFVWLSDFDSQGLMFSNRFNHYLGERVAVGLNLGLLTASRYDEGKQLYSIKNTFYMGGIEASFDLLSNETVNLRIGAGGSARHRSEINSDPEGEGTFDGSVAHIRTGDVGFNGFLENDFNFGRNGIAGGRIEYLYYSKGTPVFAIGLHVGFKF